MRKKLIAIIVMFAVAVTAAALCLSSCASELGTLDDTQTVVPGTPPQDGTDGEPPSTEVPEEPSDDSSVGEEENGSDNGSNNDPDNDDEPDTPDDSTDGSTETPDDTPDAPDTPLPPEDGGEEVPPQNGGESESPSEPDEPAHVHSLIHYSAVAATCTEAGRKEFWYCSGCGGYFSDSAAESAITAEDISVPANGHDYGRKVILPTCTEEGYAEYVCIDCGDRYEEEGSRTQPTGHTFGEWRTVTEATCTHGGEITRECGVCGASETAYTDKLTHEYGETIVVTPSTCCTEGEGVQYCVHCGGSITQRLPLVSHNYEEEAFDSTCTESGYTLYKCVWCGDMYEDNYTEPLGHDYCEWQEAVPASCDKEGEEVRSCGRCGDVQSQKTAPLGHDYEVTTFEASCTEGGYTLHKCALCGYSYTDNGKEPLGHDYEVAEIGATVDSPSVKHYRCRRCGDEYTEEGAALSSTDGLIYELVASGDGYSVTGIGADIYADELVIRDEYNGLPVYEIADGAFEGRRDIITVKLGAGIRKIGERAFFDCANLVSVNIPKGVTDIGEEAFAGCISLEEVEYQAADVASHDTNIFYNAGTGGDGITLYVADTVLSLPANLFFVIGADSLHPNLTGIEIAEGSRLEEIGEGAFKQCLKLKEVSLPASVKTIQAEAFYGCRSLISARVPCSASVDVSAFGDVHKNFVIEYY